MPGHVLNPGDMLVHPFRACLPFLVQFLLFLLELLLCPVEGIILRVNRSRGGSGAPVKAVNHRHFHLKMRIVEEIPHQDLAFLRRRTFGSFRQMRETSHGLAPFQECVSFVVRVACVDIRMVGALSAVLENDLMPFRTPTVSWFLQCLRNFGTLFLGGIEAGF